MIQKPCWVRAGVLAVVICALLSAGCAKKETKAAGEKVANVRVQAAKTMSVRPYVTAVGTLMPDEQVVASSEVDGIIRSVAVDEGMVVAKGQLLAAVDDTDYRLEVQRAEAALRQAEATLDNTTLEFNRKEALHKEELVTKQQFDDVSTRRSLVTADRERARATLALAKEKLAKTKISSPLNGVVKEKKVSPGDYVKSAMPIFTIIRIAPLKLDFTVAEKEAGKVKVGQDVSFIVDALPDRSFGGRVSVIYPHLEEKTRTLRVEALVPNHDRFLKPGFFARVTLFTGAPRNAVVVPLNTILYDESKTKIFVAEAGRARERQVKIGLKYGEMLEITDGLREKETVVTVGQNNLAEGVKLNVAR
jgi:RND family efflux transporter MFP subunit